MRTLKNSVVPAFVLTLLAACQPVPDSTRNLSGSGIEGKAFRQELLRQWDTNQGQMYTDFSALCRTNFVGLTLKAAQEKMEGAGQTFEFKPDAKAASPQGTVTMVGGLGLGGSLISSTGFHIFLVVDAQGTTDSRIVREIKACGIRSVYL